MASGAYPSSQWGRLCLQVASGKPHWMEPLTLFGGELEAGQTEILWLGHLAEQPSTKSH